MKYILFFILCSSLISCGIGGEPIFIENKGEKDLIFITQTFKREVVISPNREKMLFLYPGCLRFQYENKSIAIRAQDSPVNVRHQSKSATKHIVYKDDVLYRRDILSKNEVIELKSYEDCK